MSAATKQPFRLQHAQVKAPTLAPPQRKAKRAPSVPPTSPTHPPKRAKGDR